MIKRIYHIVILSLILISCEEYYHPDLDTIDNLLVIESLITNDTARNFVQISRTVNFNDEYRMNPVSGATCSIQSENGQTITGIENSDGYFKFPLVPATGERYKLLVTHESEAYESEYETMAPIPEIDSIYAVYDTTTTYRTDIYGKPMISEDVGFDLKVNVPITETSKYYRFTWNAVLQWEIPRESEMGPPLPSLLGWYTFHDRNIFNLAGTKEYSNTDEIENHTVLFRSMDYSNYLDSADMIPSGWIIVLQQYGITGHNYTFFDEINNQLTASGKLFDPITTQVYGNMHCTSDPEKVVLGSFDVCSHKEHRYFVFTSNMSQHVINNNIDIPEKGMTDDGTIPDFWEFSFNR